MKLIIAGSRDLEIKYPLSISDFINYFIGYSAVNEVISGGAKGVDESGEYYAAYNSKVVKKFPADWYTEGKAAGPIRNKKMAKYADALLLIWDGESRGSKNMKEEMLKLDKPVYEVILRKHNAKT